MVVTSLVDESGDHRGEWAMDVPKLTSEYGMPDGELKHGISLFPKSVWNIASVKEKRVVKRANNKTFNGFIFIYRFCQEHLITAQVICR